MNQIVCISNTRWEERPGRLDQLLRPLQDAEVLFFEPTQSIFSGLHRPREGKNVRHGVTVYTLPAHVDWSEDALPRAERFSARNANYIFSCMMEKGFRDPLLWLCCPNAIGLIDQLPHSGLIYDCDRTWPEQAAAWETELCSEADVVFAASQPLRERLCLLSSNCALLENGVDYELFSAAAKTYEHLPADLSGLRRPVLGVLEPVDDFTILEPVRYAAAAMPDCSFVFLGHVSKTNRGYSALKKLGNVHFLGEKSLRTLPRYLSGFQVCLFLGNERERTPELIPDCIYPYLASGHPIVAMEQRQRPQVFRDVIDYAASELEFLSCCQKALSEQSPQLCRRRQDYARRADWSGRSQELRHILETNGLLRARS